MESHYYHCATKGLETELLFTSRRQLIAGMNRIAICSLSFPQVVIIAFVLMDNHIHIILHGTKEDCSRFMETYKRLTEIWLNNYAPTEKGKEWDYGCWMIPNREKLAEKICYVLRNPLAAGIPIHPSCYLWGSGPLMFSGKDIGIRTENGFFGGMYGTLSPVGEMSVYQQRKLFNTKNSIPGDWLINDEGLIWPGSYVAFKRAELAFDKLQDFMFQLNKKNEESINYEMNGDEITLRDRDLMNILSHAAKETFHEDDFNLLSIKDRLELGRIVRRSHSIDIKQLSRLLHIRQKDLQLIM